MAGQKFVIPIAYKSDKTGLNQAEADLGGFGKSVAKVGGIIAAAFSTAVVIDFGKQAVKAASDLQQAVGATQAIFTEGLDKVNKFASQSATAVGISEASYRQLAATMGAMLKNTGTPMDQLADKTDSLITLAADLSATFGGDLTEATTAVAAALRGETDPIERYGISIKATNVEAKALAMTGKEVAASLTDQEKAAARVALLFEQSSASAGMFAKESDSLANIQQRLAAQFENVQAKVGAALLPVIAKLTEQLMPLVDRITPLLVTIFEALSPVIEVLVEATLPLIDAVLQLVVAFTPLIPIIADLISILLPPLVDVITELVQLITENPDLMGDTRKSFETLAAVIEPIRWTLQAIADILDAIGNNQKASANLKWLQQQGLVKATNPFDLGRKSYQGNWGVPQLAEGGIVMPRPGGTLVNVGEAGQAEAVVPLNKAGGLGTTVVINGNVGYSAEELAREIARRQAQVNALSGINRLVGVS